MEKVDIAIVGAGPHGLSLASHLRAQGADFCVFGTPMHAWSTCMPPGMFLKSDGHSSDLSGPGGGYSIEQFHIQSNSPFNKEQPIPLNVFIEYGCEFQSRYVPEIDAQMVRNIESDQDNRFILSLSSGNKVQARRVVVAVGVQPFRYTPSIFANLGAEYCSHSGEYGRLDNFEGKRVLVVGSGASAVDLAAALCRHGVDATIVSRRARIKFPGPPTTGARSLIHRLRFPDSGIGSGWRTRLYAEAPYIVHRLPRALRAHVLRTALGPSPGWFMNKEVTGRVPILNARVPRSARVTGGKVQLTMEASDGSLSALDADHVITATGYRTEIGSLAFLSKSIVRQLQVFKGAPNLSSHFESSYPGLYFIGPASAMSFGPVMRFVFGCHFMTRKLVPHLVSSDKKKESGYKLSHLSSIPR